MLELPYHRRFYDENLSFVNFFKKGRCIRSSDSSNMFDDDMNVQLNMIEVAPDAYRFSISKFYAVTTALIIFHTVMLPWRL